MKKLSLIFALFLLFNCNKTKNDQSNESKKQNIELTNVLDNKNIKSKKYVPNTDDKFDFNNKELKENLDKAILKDDTIAYKNAYDFYLNNGRSKEFLYYAILMAEKNNYKIAYRDISIILNIEDDNPLYNTFISTYGAYSMLKSNEMGYNWKPGSVNYVYIGKGKPLPKSSSIYCKD